MCFGHKGGGICVLCLMWFCFRMAKKHGMKLVYKKTFSDFFNTFKEEGEGRSLLGKMQALEVYFMKSSEYKQYV